MARLLVVEDERKILRSLERGLQEAGYEVIAAANGESGFHHAVTQELDCIVLDIQLPGRSGLEVLAGLRQHGKATPVLILTSRDTVEDRVIGLDAGADDYLVKPFAFAELLARLRALLRRGQAERETVLRAADLEVDLVQRRVSRRGVEINLTQREFELLVYLVQHQGTIVSRDMLGRDVWKEPHYALTNVIDVYINHLRRKVDRSGDRPLIQTIRGVGYILGE